MTEALLKSIMDDGRDRLQQFIQRHINLFFSVYLPSQCHIICDFVQRMHSNQNVLRGKNHCAVLFVSYKSFPDTIIPGSLPLTMLSLRSLIIHIGFALGVISA